MVASGRLRGPGTERLAEGSARGDQEHHAEAGSPQEGVGLSPSQSLQAWRGLRKGPEGRDKAPP